jgi:DNA polymerase III gamma/tau subunit
VNEILGSIGTESLYEFIGNILSSKTGEVLYSIERLTKLGKSIGVLTKDVIKTMRDLLITKTCDNPNEILNLPQSVYNDLAKLSSIAPTERLLRIIEIFAEAENNLKYTPSQRVLFETASVKATKPDTDYNIDALVSRIAMLEEKIKNGNFAVSTTASATVVEPAPAPVKTVQPTSVEPELKFSDAEITQIQGKLLTNLRKGGFEMLWNIMQNVKLSKTQTTLILIPQSTDDETIISSSQNVEKIKNALSVFGDFDLEIKEFSEKNKSTEIDDATEKLKRIFGDDIVIIKK